MDHGMTVTAITESQQPLQWAVVIATFVAATISISFRVTSRVLTRVKFWWDDWLALCCYAIDIAWIIILGIWLKNGLGQHIHEIDNKTIEEILYINKLCLFIGELFYAFALFFGKASILSFYWRMFGVTNIKIPIQVLMGCSLIWIIIRTFMGIWHCVPIEAFWDSTAGGYCAIDDSKFFFGTLLVHILIDLAILSLPVFQIRKLKLPLTQKIGVSLMFGFGIFICAAALAIMVESVHFDATDPDFTWNISMIILWASIEVNLVTVSACLPTIRPAVNFIFRQKLPGSSAMHSTGVSQGRSHHRTHRSNKMITIPSEADESGSTYQLSDSPQRVDPDGKFENHALDSHPYGVETTVISGKHAHGRDPSRPAVSLDKGRDSDEEGIMVQNETTVEVTNAYKWN